MLELRTRIGLVALTTWLIFAAVPLAAAQTRTASRTLGVEAGVIATNVAEHPTIPEDRLRLEMGPAGGVSFTSRLGDRLSLRVAATLNQKGNRLVNVGADIDSTLTLLYLELPAVVSVGLNRHATTVISVNAGAAPAFKLRGSEAGFGTTLPADDQIKLKNIDFGIVVGAEVQRKSILAGVRYTHGVFNIFDDDPALYGVDALRNRALAIYAGYLFGKR